MAWVFAGYACGVYAAFAAVAAAKLLASSAAGVTAHLSFLPLVTIALGAEVFVHGTAEDRANIRAAFASGALRRREPLLAGFVCAVLAVSVSHAIFWSKGFGTGSLALGMFAIALVLLLAPACACGWVVARAKLAIQAEEPVETRGFSVLPPSASEAAAPPSPDVSRQVDNT